MGFAVQLAVRLATIDSYGIATPSDNFMSTVTPLVSSNENPAVLTAFHTLMRHLEVRQKPPTLFILPQGGDTRDLAVKHTPQGRRRRVLNLSIDAQVSLYCPQIYRTQVLVLRLLRRGSCTLHLVAPPCHVPSRTRTAAVEYYMYLPLSLRRMKRVPFQRTAYFHTLLGHWRFMNTRKPVGICHWEMGRVARCKIRWCSKAGVSARSTIKLAIVLQWPSRNTKFARSVADSDLVLASLIKVFV